MKPFSRFLPILLGALLLGGMTGCIKIDMTLAVARDGSGTLRAVYGMPSFLVKQMELTRQWTSALGQAGGGATNVVLPAPDIPMLFDADILKTRFALMEADGLSLKGLKVREQGGWRYVDFDLAFGSLASLVKQSFFRECGVSFTHPDESTCKLQVALPRVGVTEEAAGAANPDALAAITPFLNGMRIVVRLDLPGDIRNSSSVLSDSRRATWQWDFDKDAAVLGRLTRDRIIVVFDGRQVRIRDFEKPAGVVATDR